MEKLKSSIVYFIFTMMVIIFLITALLIWNNGKRDEKKFGSETPPKSQHVQKEVSKEERWFEDESMEPEKGEAVVYGGYSYKADNDPYVIASSRTFMKHEKDKNDEMVAWLLWDTGIAQHEVMQKDMEYYVGRAHNWGTSPIGQPFLDPNAKPDRDQIVTMYSYGESGVGRIGYLADLGKQSYYEKNKTFLLFYREYLDWFQVDSVFNLKSKPDFDMTKKNFKDKQDFKDWYSTIKKLSTIDSGLKASSKNGFLVMIIQPKKNEKVVIIAKRLKRYMYKDYEKYIR